MKTTPASKLSAAVAQSQQGSYLNTLLPFCKYEQGNSSLVVVRMPKDIAAFDELWRVVEEVAKGIHIEVQRQGKWPTASELRLLLGSVKWLWEKWIPIGFVTLLVGEPGSSKSFLALDWVKHVILQDPWPLTSKPLRLENPCAVWIETESSQQLVTNRAESMNIPGDLLYMPGFGDDLLGQPDLVVEAHRERIVQATEELKPALLVVDSLGGAHSGGENKIEEVRPMLDFFARLARDRRIPVVAVHHLRKRSPGETIEVSMERVRGSSAFSAFARSIIAVESNGEHRNVRVIKANLSERADPMNFAITFNKQGNPLGIVYTEYVPPAKKRSKAERCADWVVQQLEKEGKGIRLAHLIELGEPQGFTRGILYRAKDVLGEAIEVTGDGRTAQWLLNAAVDLSELSSEEEA